MAIALTLKKYLAAKNVRYDMIAHASTSSSMQTAEACRVPGDRVARSCSVMRLAMPSQYCQRRTTFGSQNSGDSLAMTSAWRLSVRRPNYFRIARGVPFPQLASATG